jgi:hypothetical protein
MADPTIDPNTDPEVAQYQAILRQDAEALAAANIQQQKLAAEQLGAQDDTTGVDAAVIREQQAPQDDGTTAGIVAAGAEDQTPKSGTEALNPPAANTTAGSVDKVRQAGAISTAANAKQQEDWRLRLSLAPGATYLYKDPKCKQGHLLYPLVSTGGIIFPYTPQIQMNYKANYDPSDLAHTNYKQYFYKNSSVEDINITADFTAQDTTEALYLLAVIHFFRSVTKMFYGQDPLAGTPPPLCYLTGLGQYQFNGHPVLVTGFSYNLPNDVDYIRAGSTTQYSGQNVGAYGDKARGYTGRMQPGLDRLFGNKLKKGGMSGEPEFNGLSNSQSNYVPTKMSIQIQAVPVVTRYNISTQFTNSGYASGKDYAKGIW